MQKKIIALAIASALTVPAVAMAAGDTSIYGVLDAGYSSTSTTRTTALGADTKTGIAAIGFSTMTSSRLGFSHSEDLSGGMKVMAKIETGIGSNANAGAAASPITTAPVGSHATNGTTIDATSLGNRELNISLMMDATTVKAGYGSTMVRDISLGYAPDPGGNLVGNILNADSGNLSSNRAAGVTVNQGFGGGMSGTVQLTAKTRTADGTADEKNGNGYLLGAQYANGPISVAGAYQNQKTTTIAVSNPNELTNTTRKIFILGGSYDLQVAKLIAEYANIKADESVAGTSAKNTYLSFGAQAPVGDMVQVFAQYSTGKVNNGAASETDRTIKGFTVGGKYSMAKSTYGYASVGNIKQDHDTVAAGYKFDQFALGLVHTF